MSTPCLKPRNCWRLASTIIPINIILMLKKCQLSLPLFCLQVSESSEFAYQFFFKCWNFSFICNFHASVVSHLQTFKGLQTSIQRPIQKVSSLHSLLSPPLINYAVSCLQAALFSEKVAFAIVCLPSNAAPAFSSP